MKYDILDFKTDQDLFNDITGASQETNYSALLAQTNLISEELDETYEALENKDLVGLLDGAIDTLYTTLGLLQKLENMGIDVQAATFKVAKDNLSKFPTSRDIALDTIEYYNKQGIDCSLSTKAVNGQTRYVIRDSNGKVRKPVGFKPTNLLEFVFDKEI